MNNKFTYISLLLAIEILTLKDAQAFHPAPEMSEDAALAARHFAAFSYKHAAHQGVHTDADHNGQQWHSFPFRLHDAQPNDPHVGAVFQRNDKIIIAFHGSDFIYDWVQDFKFWHKSGTSINLPGNVHAGFSQVLESVTDTANPASLNNALLNAYQNGQGPYEYIFTGHSLGAALSTLSAGSLTFNNSLPEAITKNQVKVVNFSSPKIGDSTLIDAIENSIEKHNILCFANEGDVVTYLPCGDYRRAGIWINVTPVEAMYGIASNTISSFSPRRVRLADVMALGGVAGVSSWIYERLSGVGKSITAAAYVLAMHSIPSESIVHKKFFDLKSIARRTENYEDLQRIVEQESTWNVAKNII